MVNYTLAVQTPTVCALVLTPGLALALIFYRSARTWASFFQMTGEVTITDVPF